MLRGFCIPANCTFHEISNSVILDTFSIGCLLAMIEPWNATYYRILSTFAAVNAFSESVDEASGREVATHQGFAYNLRHPIHLSQEAVAYDNITNRSSLLSCDSAGRDVCQASLALQHFPTCPFDWSCNVAHAHSIAFAEQTRTYHTGHSWLGLRKTASISVLKCFGYIIGINTWE